MKSDVNAAIQDDRPINSRTVNRRALGLGKEDKIGSQTTEQLNRIEARILAQEGLAQRVNSTTPPSKRIHITKILTPVFLLLGSGMIILGARLPSTIWVVAGGALLCGAIFSFWSSLKQNQGSESNNLEMPTQLVSTEDLQQFDLLIASASSQLSELHIAQLHRVKEHLASLLELSAKVKTSEHFTTEDQMYIREAVRRYIPDSLEAYLKIPKHLRSEHTEVSNTSASQLLLNQLNMIDEKLIEKEKKLGLAMTEFLLKQERFLIAKNQ